jgi:sulfate/thiosulfate transport system substrate-binding protein
MKRSIQITLVSLLTLILTAVIPAAAQDAPPPVTLTFVAYSTPREAYGEIIPLFQAKWLEETGQQVILQESYGGSGSQSRAVAGGFEADLVALSLESDVTRLVDAGLITHDWKDNPYQGIVSNSLVAFAVRPDNPKNITDWAGLVQDGIEVITPNPATSGGAQWNVLAAVGAVQRGHVEGFDASEEGATEFLSKLLTNVSVLDKDARESFLNFERGIGDVAITYENEIITGQLGGQEYQVVYPSSTILIETPVALVDTYVDKHGTREVAQAFYEFLWSTEAQRVFVQYGYRPLNEEVAAEFSVNVEGAEPVDFGALIPLSYPPIADQFTIVDQFTDWPTARTTYFGDEGLFTQLVAEIKGT